MNRQMIERARQSALVWADKFKSEKGDQLKDPATPNEAYARASWCAEMRAAELCKALLADLPDEAPVPASTETLSTLAKLHAIEETATIYEIAYRNAGVGFMFFEGAVMDGTEAYRNTAAWRQHLVVHSYYPTFEAAVDGEYERLVPSRTEVRS